MIAIISDVHGNYEALSAVLREIDKRKVETIICLGDVVGYYSQVNECCDELRKRGIKCLMGNHDWYMASGMKCERSQSVNDCLNYQRKVISEENLEWIKGFASFYSDGRLKAVHGGWINPIDEYLEPNEEYFERISGHYFASGHTHIQMVKQYGDTSYCNPGSVGQPRDGDPRAAYAMLDDEGFKLFRVEYDIDKVCNHMAESGFNPYY